jgi:Aminotransferase class-V
MAGGVMRKSFDVQWCRNQFPALATEVAGQPAVTPWMLAARDASATVRCVDIRAEDCTLDLDDFTRKLSERTRLVAIAGVSNAVGTINPIEDIIEAAHAHGALVFVDAVHHAPHVRIHVDRWGCDFLACSAYKFFGPHVGVLWGRRELLESHRRLASQELAEYLGERGIFVWSGNFYAQPLTEALGLEPDGNLKQTAIYYHGEKVAIGVLAGLFLADRPSSLIDEVYDFCESVGLPTTLAGIGIGDASDDDLRLVAEGACAGGETIHRTDCLELHRMHADQ